MAVYVRTVKTASGGTAVQAVHSAHYPGTLHDALTASTGTQVRTSWPSSSLAPVKAAALIRRPAGRDPGCAWPAGEQPRYALPASC